MNDRATAIGWEQLGPTDREREYSPSSRVDDVSRFIALSQWAMPASYRAIKMSRGLSRLTRNCYQGR